MVICATIGSEQMSRMAAMPCSISAMFDMVSSTKRSTPPSRSAAACSRKYSRASSSDGRSVRLDADAERTDGAGDVDGVARRLARQRRAALVDGAQLVLDAEAAQLDAVRAVGVGLDDLRAGAHVLLVHLEHDLRIAEIQLVVALVDEDALGVEHRPHRAIEEVDVLVCDCLNEVRIKKKPHAGIDVGPNRKTNSNLPAI